MRNFAWRNKLYVVILKHNASRLRIYRNVVTIECAIDTVCPLLDRHRELLQRLCVESTLAQDTSQLASKSAFMILPSKESDRLSTLATSPCIMIKYK